MTYTPRMYTAYCPRCTGNRSSSNANGFSRAGVYPHARRYLRPVLVGEPARNRTIDGRRSSTVRYI